MTKRSLDAYLLGLPPGPIADPTDLEGLLGAHWDQFEGSDSEGMKGSKLFGRMDEVLWQPPVLTFVIERHGGTVLGSSRADRHRWELDLEARRAVCSRIGHRQLMPMAPRLDVRPLAQQLAQSIVHRQLDDRLRWATDGSVRVQIGRIIPAGSAVAQTLQGRRRRFWLALGDILREAGWSQLRHGVYRPSAT